MKKFFPAIFILLIVMVVAIPIFLTKVNTPQGDLTHSSSGYWVVNLTDNKTLTHTSIPLNIGDQYISSDNKIYLITKIMKDKVYVKQIE